jgi:hypothetical protein
LHSAFLNEAESIAEIRNCDLDTVLDFLLQLTEESYDCPRIPEIHQTWFFGEVQKTPDIDGGKRTNPRLVGRGVIG